MFGKLDLTKTTLDLDRTQQGMPQRLNNTTIKYISNN